ncbi:MAG: metallophosphoesterase [bacterium]|nr:MAG: metallophosphoesterase [bacterium]
MTVKEVIGTVMSLFLIIYYSIYGGMHAYFFFKVHQALNPTGWRLLALILFLLLMVNGPVLVRLLERKGDMLPATLFAYVSYFWMAGLLWFLFLGITRDLWNTGVRLASFITPESYRLIIPPRPAFFVTVLLITVAAVAGFIEARGLRTERVVVETDLFPAGSGPVKVAQISDVHLGLIEGQRRIDQILSILHAERPDILLASGDILDGMAHHVDSLSSSFAAFQPPLGKFAVTGNHEYYVGLADSLSFLEKSGFRVLRGEAVHAGPLRLAGVDDPAGRQTGQASYLDEGAALAMGDQRRFTILVKHQPLVEDSSVGRFQLQVSGHTHKGQIFPFNYPVRIRYRYIAGLFDLARGSLIYTSRGTGTWGPPLRLFSPPEVTIYTIKAKG